jgi:DNA-binding IclR family transcriptional regulator
MTAAAAVAHFLKQFPALPPEAAPVFFLLCAQDHLTVPGIARRLDLAQSTTARLLALLSEAGLVCQRAQGPKAVRWQLAPAGRTFAESASANL